MSEDSLAFVLRSDKLKMDELDILSKVKEWASVNAVSHTLLVLCTCTYLERVCELGVCMYGRCVLG